MQTLCLQDLLDGRHPAATFQDAVVEGLAVDYVRRTAELALSLVVRDAKEPELEPGTLRFEGVLFVSNEMPAAPMDEWREDGLWLTADGSLPDDKIEVSASLPRSLPDDAFVHYLFFSDLNGYMVIAARGASFEWD